MLWFRSNKRKNNTPQRVIQLHCTYNDKFGCRNAEVRIIYLTYDEIFNTKKPSIK